MSSRDDMDDGAEQRHVSLLVGRKSYNITTSLDEASLARVYGIVHDAADEIDPAIDQDDRLFIVAMMLANNLVSMMDSITRLSELMSRMPEFAAPPQEGGPQA